MSNESAPGQIDPEKYGEFTGSGLLSVGIRGIIDERKVNDNQESTANNIYSIIFAADTNILGLFDEVTDQGVVDGFLGTIREILNMSAGSNRNSLVKKLIKDMNGVVDHL